MPKHLSVLNWFGSTFNHFSFHNFGDVCFSSAVNGDIITAESQNRPPTRPKPVVAEKPSEF